MSLHHYLVSVDGNEGEDMIAVILREAAHENIIGSYAITEITEQPRLYTGRDVRRLCGLAFVAGLAVSLLIARLFLIT